MYEFNFFIIGEQFEAVKNGDVPRRNQGIRLRDAITQQQIMRKAGLSLIASNEFLNLLVRLDIIREENIGPKAVYTITDKGQRLCTYFGLDEDSIFYGTGIFRTS